VGVGGVLGGVVVGGGGGEHAVGAEDGGDAVE
jgi:hypothetical protein